MSYEDVLLIIVNYNQEAEIEAVLRELPKFFPVAQTIVVDDGSTDSSPEIARRVGFRVLRHEVNRGVGAVLRSGLKLARDQGYSTVAIMSSNGKTRPCDLPKIIEPVVSGAADYSTGTRFLAGGSSPGLGVFRRIAIPIFSVLAWPFLGRYFSDITCGFRCYRLNFLFQKPVNIDQEWLNRYEMEYYIHYWACRLNLQFSEVPVVIPYNHLDRRRRSKIVPVLSWWSMVRPLLFLRFGLRH